MQFVSHWPWWGDRQEGAANERMSASVPEALWQARLGTDRVGSSYVCGVVRVLASEHGDARQPWFCAASNCCCCATWACCPRWTPTPPWPPCAPKAATRWWPKAACAPPRRPTAPAWRAASGVRCKRRWTKPPVTPPPCVLAPLWPAELKPQLRAVLQYHCGSPVLRTRQLMMDLQSL